MESLGKRADTVTAIDSKTIRIWQGSRVLQIITISNNSVTSGGSLGGAENSTPVDIEIDPWAGLIVEHGITHSPVLYREVDNG